MEKLYCKNFRIADLNILLESDREIQIDKEFVEFEAFEGTDFHICFRTVQNLKPIEEMPVALEMGFRVFSVENGYLYQFLGTDDMPYAISIVDWSKKKITVKYMQNAIKHISHTGGAFFHIRWEELMLKKSRLILHACSIDTTYGGILFSGDSGVGKSTQGDLWCRYENSRIINEDRPILYKDEHGWCAFGSPYAGSSEYHVNDKTRIKMIVLLKQSKTCAIHRISVAEAFRRIFSQLTIAAWNPESVNSACNLVEQLVTDIPIYEMQCTPDKTAVELLKTTIAEERGGIFNAV